MTNPQEQLPESPRQEVHPLSEVQLSPNEVEAVASAMEVVKSQRAETGIENLKERFSGILPMAEGNRLIVVDYAEHTGENTNSRFFVHTTLLGEFEASGTVAEETVDTYVPSYRDFGRQADLPTSLGKVYIFRDLAEDSPQGEEDAPQFEETASLFLERDVAEFPPNLFTYRDKTAYLKKQGIQYEGRFSRDDIMHSTVLQEEVTGVPLKDIFAPVTTEDKIEVARRELATRAKKSPYAKRQVGHIHDALGSGELEDTDRQRLLELGSSIVEIVENDRENATRDAMIADPLMAERMAIAENEVRLNPPQLEEIRGLFKGGKRAAAQQSQQRELRNNIRSSHIVARTEYTDSLQRPLPPTSAS